MGDQCTLRLMREIRLLQNGDSLAMTVHYNERDICDIWALMIGSPGTPYAYGFYQFAIKIPPEYPAKPPKVAIKTTNRGQTRFGPNLYSCGKVCLSILGTWPGKSGEQWSPAQGLESALLSIQSLLSIDPYYNEPGFEKSTSNLKSEENHVQDYNSKICHENLRLTVIEPLEKILKLNEQFGPEAGSSPGSWHQGVVDDYMKQRFLWYLEQYKQTIEEQSQEISIQKRDKVEFPLARFECGGNEMRGFWDYQDLRKRLNNLENKLVEETLSWPEKGLEMVAKDVGIAVSLRGQHGQIASQINRITESMVELEIVNDNPFLWRVTYFGRPMTRFDGGVLRIKIYISPRHPVEQPRVFFETPIFHIRVSPKGALIYLPARAEEMSRHIEGIINTLEEEAPPYNPLMTVNPEATKLYWGSKEEQRLYNRKLRLSIAEATE
ncbi:Ubiquitin-conjugating enzyme E2 [Penicillium waksmanii]|uniref:Ubiquitin-conjugating enzyme E2 n=1 Tax=Penicillium waksmanii TaxID=69791 RepID=UPI0025474918|nr:Ubiquitin-conjugating enzyme E2 [Penicillium waksmanii]KAJ5999712.1 Ubiquitin-conjugating enzyme E2 [Penicillium waksmanii]